MVCPNNDEREKRRPLQKDALLWLFISDERSTHRSTFQGSKQPDIGQAAAYHNETPRERLFDKGPNNHVDAAQGGC